MSEFAVSVLGAWTLYAWLPMSTLLPVPIGSTPLPPILSPTHRHHERRPQHGSQGVFPVFSLLHLTPVFAPPAAIPLARAPL